MQLGMLAPQLGQAREQALLREERQHIEVEAQRRIGAADAADDPAQLVENRRELRLQRAPRLGQLQPLVMAVEQRSEEHTSELQSLMRISYAVCCVKKKKAETKHSIHRRR